MVHQINGSAAPGLIKRLPLNTRGRDLAVGDIHGYFTKLRAALDAVGFDPEVDRVISVGDLVDRGPECDSVQEWLSQPWFHAVRGNHEDMAIHFAAGDMDIQMYVVQGGGWNVGNPPAQRAEIASAFSVLPMAIEVETADGLVGVVHATCPTPTWSYFAATLRGLEHTPEYLASMEVQNMLANALWSRDKVMQLDDTSVADMRAVVVGHTPVERVTSLGNTIFIDTGAWLARDPGRAFAVLDLDTLQPAHRGKA
jgi:serine/threonine protein phosphatase 1